MIRGVGRSLRNFFQKVTWLIRFFFRSYRNHWLASPAGAIAALVSTFGAAALMIFAARVSHDVLETPSAIIVNAIVGPLVAYVLYLSTYYLLMFWKEYEELLSTERSLDREKLRNWLRVVKYDYLGHLPSDAYLIPLAGMMQAGLEAGGMPIFWAVVLSQGADDLITFLKEPALWNGAKEVVAWEDRENTTVRRRFIDRLLRRGDA